MFRFLHAADIHLDSPLTGLERYEGAPADEMRGATRHALENLVDLALEESVALVLIAGDLYDSDWKEFRTGLFFVKQMNRLREAGIRVFVVAGNHDAANKMTHKLPLRGVVETFPTDRPETIVVDQYGVAIHGQSFGQAAVTKNLAAEYPDATRGLFNIGLLHTSVNGREGHDTYAPCTIEELRAKGYDYWALGHIHKREELSRDPPVHFCGNPQGRHIRETGPKGCLLVTVDDEHRVEVEPRWLDVLRWELCTVSAAGVQSEDDLLERVQRRLEELVRGCDGKPLAARVRIEGPCALHRGLTAEPDRWMNQVRGAAQGVGGEVWIEKVTLGTTPPPELDPSQWADGPLGELVQYVAELKASPESQATLAAELADFFARLPAELKESPHDVRLARPEVLREVLDQVEQTLIHQLLSKEAGK